MKNRSRRHSWSKVVVLCTICISVLYATYLNYKFVRLNSSENDLLDFQSTHNSVEDFNDQCFKARVDSVPAVRYGKLNYPFINLGFPKIGSSSIHSFFGCAGYRSTHFRCSRETKCCDCIRDSVQNGYVPLHNCIYAEVYSQIDDGRNFFPQIEYLDELLGQYPNATFFLTFRKMENWYHSLSKWTRNGTRMDQDLMLADIKGFPSGTGRNVHEFSAWFCNHVRRVRHAAEKQPSLTLIEIDLDDERGTRQRMSELLDVDANCWGRSNANLELHPELSNQNTITAEGQSKWFLVGSRTIKGKNGSRRIRNYSGKQFLNYP